MAYGKVLITGLGFGFLLNTLINKKEVKEIHVLEKNLDIVNLFKKNNSHIKNIKYINDDASLYQTKEFYDCILIDHYETQSFEWRVDEVKNISKNIPNHNLIWGWSFEVIYDLIKNLDLKIPNLDDHKAKEYLDYYKGFKIFTSGLLMNEYF